MRIRPENLQTVPRTSPDTPLVLLIRKLERMNTRIKVHNLTHEEIQRIGENIYIYGYPLLLMVFSIVDRDRPRLNPDNSLAVHIQHDWPGAAEDSNWLPSPKDTFSLALRLYLPKRGAIGGSWRPPAVMRSIEV